MICSIPNLFRHILSYLPIQGASNRTCLHTVSIGVSLYQLVTYVIFYQFENKKIESLRYRKKTLKLTTYDSRLTLIRLRVVLCALHELNYNLKVVILAFVI